MEMALRSQLKNEMMGILIMVMGVQLTALWLRQGGYVMEVALLLVIHALNVQMGTARMILVILQYVLLDEEME